MDVYFFLSYSEKYNFSGAKKGLRDSLHFYDKGKVGKTEL